MAARRGKTQARRNSGDGGLPGWAWMVLGILLAVVVILVAPKYLKSDGDGFFRPQPNPDARPAPVDDVGVADEAEPRTPRAAAGPAGGKPAKKAPDYDFYTLLPGREVPMSDAELAASERAEAERARAAERQARAAPATTPSDAALPKPLAEAPPAANVPPPATAPATTPAPAAPRAADTAPAPAAAAAADDGTRYLLQAGAFQASGQAEEMKARIAMLGLSARVESAQLNGATVYRVRMGPYGTASDLAEAKRKLASGGLSAMAIKVK
ncbi:cell division protein FtsN [Vulcaniibacterium tengchongense]|uniref:Cell division protein FtsN n=2 Tax=Vulcaniibacterium tengchongense TaxID=1273429 RepID=A0A3N4V4N1_9GAMM|nr:SPOR domain-containing protein [Vulcaniibacterium tengchongense]RPE74711.1 cell division protein FtsN [Vulcaniibacterium tengchongense]